MAPHIPKNQGAQILVIEDNPLLEQVLIHSLKNIGVDVLATETPEDAIQEIEQRSPSLVIYDTEKSNPAAEIVEAINNHPKTELLILHSGRLSDQDRKKLQPKEVIYKPFDTRFVCRRVIDLLSKNKSRKETNAVNFRK